MAFCYRSGINRYHAQGFKDESRGAANYSLFPSLSIYFAAVLSQGSQLPMSLPPHCNAEHLAKTPRCGKTRSPVEGMR